PVVPVTARNDAITAFDNNLATPYVQTFNVSIQRELAKNLTLDVGYVGTKGTKLTGNINLNSRIVVENGLLEAFKQTEAGGNAPLFDKLLMGVNVTGVGTV